ncbi:DUF423 domain-containing protein [Kistimonas asteriae]|uniref:DUF423 domain-containing protein n=1 Tax=Kistimonas asteriae TaxID=517724 RepID=UPI001BAE3629|nr:DUF423 domain-containing protein [Kistimonas asteriae]
MSRFYLFIAALSGLLVVALGAFGAHALEAKLTASMLVTWGKAVDYQMFHTLALAFTALLGMHYPADRWLKLSARLFMGGTILFSGSLYLLVLTGTRSLGMITPFGGVAFMLGWLSLSLFAARNYQLKI